MSVVTSHGDKQDDWKIRCCWLKFCNVHPGCNAKVACELNV